MNFILLSAIIATSLSINCGQSVYPVCPGGGVVQNLTESTGTIGSPFYPDSNYPNNANCRWRILSTQQFVQLDFLFFATTSWDYVYIFDGYNDTGPGTEQAVLIGSITNPPPGSYETTQSYMYVRFYSDSNYNAAGFEARFTSIPVRQQCPVEDQNLTESTGTFSSPFYPSYYPDNTNCRWRITSFQQYVQLEFLFFSTQGSDPVSVFDGYNAESVLLARLSGYYNLEPPGPYESTQAYMYVRFTSDYEYRFTGFEARYTSISVRQTCPTEVQYLNGFTGTFTSPQYPLNYFPNSNCQWRISSSTQFVRLDFLFFKLDNAAYVYIRDGYDTTSDLIVRLTGDSSNRPPGPYTTTQSYMHVQFTSGSLSGSEGFQASYTSVSDGDACSADSRPLQITVVTDGSGMFASSTYPHHYNNDTDCQWLIMAKYSGGFISLQFDDFDTEACCDFVSVHDGTSTKDPVIAVLSGTYSDLPRRYSSTQANMFIRFKTDSTDTSKGFLAQYSSMGTGGACLSESDPLEVTSLTGTIQSSYYPAKYAYDTTCQWLITSIYSTGFVTLDFDFFQTEACCDRVTIFDGDSVKTPMLAVLSGSYEPAPGNFTTTQRMMFVRFVSDETNNDDGFSATYTSKDIGGV